MDNVQNIYIDLLDNKNNQFIYTKKNDKGRKIIFRFTKNGEVINISDVAVKFTLRRLDGVSIINTLSKTDTTAILVLTETLTDVSGLHPFQITLVNNATGSQISTVTSYMLCEEVN